MLKCFTRHTLFRRNSLFCLLEHVKPLCNCAQMWQIPQKNRIGCKRYTLNHSSTIFQTKIDQHIGSSKIIRCFASYPSHTKITLPALSPTMETGSLVSWEKKEGDEIKEGDVLAEIETDKATMSMDVNDPGFLAKILVPAGSRDIPVGQLLCIVVENAEDVAAFRDFKDDSPAPAPAAAPVTPQASTPVEEPAAAEATPMPAPEAVSQAPTESGSRTYVSPMAKKLAESQQLRLHGKGSGVHGSIKSTDLGAMTAAGATRATGPRKPRGPNNFQDIPLSNMRSVIAKRLLESKQTVPHFYVSIECQLDNLLRLREKTNKQFEKRGIRISLNDFVIKATACACLKVPEANSHWMDKVIRQFEHVDVSVAVSTDGGLFTPIIFAADEKGVIEISDEVKELANKARQNKLKPEEFQGGTVCISNMGMLGVTNFCAIINPPQTLILAVGTSTKKLIPDDKNPKGFRVVNVMLVTVSADHRIVDGAVAARWCQHFRDFIEEPGAMLL